MHIWYIQYKLRLCFWKINQFSKTIIFNGKKIKLYVLKDICNVITEKQNYG